MKGKLYSGIAIVVLGLILAVYAFRTDKKPASMSGQIAFWNVENLFDTINDKSISDEDFLPTGKLKWTSERYNTKLSSLAKVIRAIGNGSGPDIIGLAEIENKAVLIDLTQKTELKSLGYEIVHYNSPDKRGIDVAMLYKKGSFKLLKSKSINVSIPEDTLYTRDILLVKGVYGKSDTMYLFVNHWPSRRGGQDDTEKKRLHASACLKQSRDSILKLEPNAQILAMGDFNDEPTNKSILALSYVDNSANGFVNLMDALKAAGEGTHHYKKEKSLLDQILVTKSFQVVKGYYVIEGSIFHPDWMYGENYKGDPPGPLHTYAGSRYIGGYSDHFPVYVDLKKQK
jgi:endonuclease/exonuclease/phosphatase family metal-dependent hydrolase